MKRTWKILSNTKKHQAIRDVRVLVSKGNSITKARKLVADRLGVRPNTIANWALKLDTNTTTMTNGYKQRTVGVTRPHITSVDLHVPGKGNVTLDHEMLMSISRLAGFTS